MRSLERRPFSSPKALRACLPTRWPCRFLEAPRAPAQAPAAHPLGLAFPPPAPSKCCQRPPPVSPGPKVSSIARLLTCPMAEAQPAEEGAGGWALGGGAASGGVPHLPPLRAPPCMRPFMQLQVPLQRAGVGPAQARAAGLGLPRAARQACAQTSGRGCELRRAPWGHRGSWGGDGVPADRCPISPRRRLSLEGVACTGSQDRVSPPQLSPSGGGDRRGGRDGLTRMAGEAFRGDTPGTGRGSLGWG